MKAVLLDGSQENDSTSRRVRAALIAQLQYTGWEVEHIVLRDKKIGNCAGDFFCWVRSPGLCNVNDDNRPIAQAIAASNLMVYLTPVTFGGYSSALKRMVDHLIQNVLPFFSKLNGETHHKKRYENYPDLLAVGWMDSAHVRSEAVFRHLVQRNALNWHCQTWVSDVVLADPSDEELLVSARGWLTRLRNGQSSRPVELPDGSVAGNGTTNVRRALLLVGSPKTRKSTSNSLGGYLSEQLVQRSVPIETIYLHTVLRNPQKMQALLDAVDAADLITLAFPLYVDTLPAPVTEALERIAMHRQSQETRPQLFTAIANCGFPEAYQTATALAICEIFARQTGFLWAGSLALGAGEMINGASLFEAGAKAARIRSALEMAAEALALGKPIPIAAQEMMARPVIPHWAYRLTGKMRWKREAKGYGAEKLLKRRPYLARE